MNPELVFLNKINGYKISAMEKNVVLYTIIAALIMLSFLSFSLSKKKKEEEKFQFPGSSYRKEIDIKEANLNPEKSLDQSFRDIYDNMQLSGNGLSFSVFHDAIVRFYELKSQNLIKGKNLLSIADMEKSSKEKRFFVLDLDAGKVLFNTYVSHGKGSGNEYAKVFSNIPNSNMTSIGMYITGETYFGKNGYSLRLDGMDKGYNDKARERAIVIHGAPYSSPSFIPKTGRLGRSQGCPSLPLENHKEIINTIANGTALFISSGDKGYKESVIMPVAEALLTKGI